MSKFVKTKKIEPLYLPYKNGREKGIQVVCKVCGTYITNKMETCTHPEKQVYKVLIHVPGTNGKKRTKNLPTRDYKRAVLLAKEFEDELKYYNFSENIEQQDNDHSLLLDEMMVTYKKFLQKDGIYQLKSKRIRGSGHISQVDRVFDEFKKSLIRQGDCKKSILITEITDRMIRKFLTEITNTPSKYNHTLSILGTFFTKMKKLTQMNIPNPTEGYEQIPIKTNPKSIPVNEFNRLLEIIKPENGTKYYSNYSKKKKDEFYRPWLISALKLTYLTGRRREDVLESKFSDIIEDEEGMPIILNMGNTKIERSKGIQRFPDPVPIFPQFRDFLLEIGYNEFKGTDRYIIGHDCGMERETMKNFMSKAFSHFYNQLNTGKQISQKSIRKASLTRMKLSVNGNANNLTGHAGEEVLNKYYYDKLIIALDLAKKDITMF